MKASAAPVLRSAYVEFPFSSVEGRQVPGPSMLHERSGDATSRRQVGPLRQGSWSRTYLMCSRDTEAEARSGELF